MRIGLYTFASLALIGLIAAFAYTINPGNYMYEFAGINLNLPIALWIAIPMLVLLVMTIFHMIYHGAKSYFAKRRWIRDASEIEDALYWAVLKQPKGHNFSIPEIKSSASILSVASLELLDSTEGLSDKLGKTINWVKKIQLGEYIDLKEKKVAKFLSKDNPLVIQNCINRLKDNSEFAESVLLSKDSYDETIISASLDALVANESFFKIRKFANSLNSSHLRVLFDRANDGEDIGMTADNLEYIAQNVDMKCKDYMLMAKTAVKQLTPDENLAIFKKMAEDKDVAQTSYLYLLFQYEMLDAAKHYLEESDESEFKPFRALYVLKKGKYNYRLSEMISIDTVCHED